MSDDTIPRAEAHAMVAAALTEAVEIYRGLAEGAPVGASDGQTFAVRFVTPKEFEAAIRARAAELKGEAR